MYSNGLFLLLIKLMVMTLGYLIKVLSLDFVQSKYMLEVEFVRLIGEHGMILWWICRRLMLCCMIGSNMHWLVCTLYVSGDDRFVGIAICCKKYTSLFVDMMMYVFNDYICMVCMLRPPTSVNRWKKACL